jgi:hypothetical protein
MITYQTVIGRSELVSFPELFLDHVPAKSDTGAYRSAVHATNIEIKTKNKKKVLCFDLLGDHPNAVYSRHIETAEFGKTTVENSFGVDEERYTVKLKIKIGPRSVRTEFSLADRRKKTYPILLGRTLLNKKFLIDSSKSNIDRRELKAKMNIDLVDDEDLEMIDP